MYQPKTGEQCSCKSGLQRDNCPRCEGTGMAVDFRAIRMFEQMPIEFRLKQAVTAFDRKAKERAARRVRGAYHNPYALPQYFRAIDDVMEEVRAGAGVREALTASLSGKLLDVCLIAVGEPHATVEEHRR